MVDLTPLERRALALIWNDIDPGFGETFFGPPDPNITLEEILGEFRTRYNGMARVSMRAIRLQPTEIKRDQDGVLIVSGPGAKDRAYEAHVRISADGQVQMFAIARALPPGTVARLARRDEYETVAELIRDAPVVTGERTFSIWLKRLPEALAMQRDFGVIVIERVSDGRLLATRLAGLRHAIYSDEAVCVGHAYQAGVLPEARGQGFENALIPYMVRVTDPRAQRFYGLIDAGNAAIMQSMGGERLPLWGHTARQVGLGALSDAEAFGRPATPDDVPLLLAMLIGAHGRKEWRAVRS